MNFCCPRRVQLHPRVLRDIEDAIGRLQSSLATERQERIAFEEDVTTYVDKVVGELRAELHALRVETDHRDRFRMLQNSIDDLRHTVAQDTAVLRATVSGRLDALDGALQSETQVGLAWRGCRESLRGRGGK